MLNHERTLVTSSINLCCITKHSKTIEIFQWFQIAEQNIKYVASLQQLYYFDNHHHMFSSITFFNAVEKKIKFKITIFIFRVKYSNVYDKVCYFQ